MNRLFPKKDPEAARKLLATPDEALTNTEREKKHVLALHATPMPCPMCFEKINVYDAADETCAVGDTYNGRYVCTNCDTELAKVVPFFMVPGTPGWHWQRKYPIAGKTEGDRVFSMQELELLVEEHDAIKAILVDPDARRRRRDPPLMNAGTHKELRLVTPTRLVAYLERRGWTIDEGGSDEVDPGLGKPGGGVCTRTRSTWRKPRSWRGRGVGRPRRGLLAAAGPRRAAHAGAARMSGGGRARACSSSREFHEDEEGAARWSAGATRGGTRSATRR